MNASWRWAVVMLPALLLLGCEESGISTDRGKSKRDGQVDGSRGGDGQSRDGGPGSDVVIGNEGGTPASDGGHVDSCVPPKSCPILFSYPKGNESKVELHGDFDGWGPGVPMTLSGSTWQATLTLDNGKQVLYKFVLDGTTWVPDPNNPKQTTDGFNNSVLDVICPSSCAPAPDGGTPPTGFDWRDAVLYFVLLDRFNNGDTSNDGPEPGVEGPANWQGGDLKGLLDKIQSGYFDSLGVNALWISSPVDAPTGKWVGDDGHDYTGYHGYWPTDLTKVEEHLGDLALLKQVVGAAHQKNLKVIVDYVMNHVHQQSPTYQSHADWFWPLQYSGHDCVCGQGCSWDSSPEKERCWFETYLPDFDFQVQPARDFSVGNAIQWAKDEGVDGFRLDAVKHIETSWLTDLRSQLKAQGLQTAQQPFYLIGETFTNDQGLMKSYIDPATKLDGQFDFPLRAVLVRTILMRQGSFWDLENFLASNTGYYGPGAIMGTFLGNHDLPRAIHLAEDTPQFGEWDGGKNRAWNNQPAQPGYASPYQRLGLGFTALLTLPGVPLIYYGDEIGMAGAGDPDNRQFMKWSGTSSDQDGLRTLISTLTKIRAAHPCLRRGSRQQLWVSDTVYAYQMSSGTDKLVVVLNRSDSEQSIDLQGTSYTDLLNGGTVAGAGLKVPARTARILQ